VGVFCESSDLRKARHMARPWSSRGSNERTVLARALPRYLGERTGSVC